MMGEGMSGGMMFGMGLIWVLIILVLILAVAALIKYLRNQDNCEIGGHSWAGIKNRSSW
jgi:uncharacterized membrane protein